ncbi:MAG: lipoate-protein ligase [Pseudomonadota bacterium]
MTEALPTAVWWGRVPYEPAWRRMQAFTETRTPETPDQLWCLEHPPTFTQGMAGKAEHVLAAGDIPVVGIDRGGQVTYHGPGQLVVYPLLDLRRLGLGVRDLVTAIEQAIIAYAADFGIVAVSRRDAPGVYVGEAKLAALGLRIRRGCSYHGLALNVRMDLAPYQRINPCGYAGMAVTELTALAPSAPTDVRAVAAGLLPHLWRELRLPGAYTELREGDFEAAGDTAAAVTVAGDAAPTV